MSVCNVKLIIFINNNYAKDVHKIVKNAIWIVNIILSVWNALIVIFLAWIINVNGAVYKIVLIVMSSMTNKCHCKNFHSNKIIKQNKLDVQYVNHLINWIYKLDHVNRMLFIIL